MVNQKISKSLFINNEVARIEIEGNNIRFLLANNECLYEVTYSEFKEFLKDISFVCLTSWNKDLQKNYIEYVQYFSKL